MMVKQYKEGTCKLLHSPAEISVAAFWTQLSIKVLILLSVLIVVLESIPELWDQHGRLFLLFEFFFVTIFTLEYGLRLWAITSEPRYRCSLAGRFRYAFSTLALFDLIAILPAWIYLIIVVYSTGANPTALLEMLTDPSQPNPTAFFTFRVLRLLRLFRLTALFKYYEAVKTFGRALSAKWREVSVAFIVFALLWLISSSLMHFMEPAVFSSIPQAMRWILFSIANLEKGSIGSLTIWGKIGVVIVTFMGIGIVFVMPAAILASAFVEQVKREITIIPPSFQEVLNFDPKNLSLLQKSRNGMFMKSDEDALLTFSDQRSFQRYGAGIREDQKTHSLVR